MYRFSIDYWGAKASVEWDSPELTNSVRALLLPIWTDDPSVEPEGVFRIFRETSQTVRIHGPNSQSVPVETTRGLGALERQFHLYLASHSRDAVFVHAGVLEFAGKAWVIPGKSYSGKSTLVEALVRKQAGFYSDEYAVFDHSGLVHPFPRPMTLRQADGGRNISATELGWSPPSRALPLGGVLVFPFDPKAVWSPRVMSPSYALMQLLANSVAVRLAPESTLRTLSLAIEETSNWVGPRPDAEEVAGHILDFLSAAT